MRPQAKSFPLRENFPCKCDKGANLIIFGPPGIFICLLRSLAHVVALAIWFRTHPNASLSSNAENMSPAVFDFQQSKNMFPLVKL